MILVPFVLILSVSGGIQAQSATGTRTFNPGADLISLHYDHAPDLDDGQSAAADRTMLESLFGRAWLAAHVVAVSGAYGKNGPQFVPASDRVMDAAWGDAGGWLAAHRDREGAIDALTTRWIRALKAGGDIWVKEGGQSDITAAAVKRLPAPFQNEARTRIHVIQHSTWNEDQTTPDALEYSREHTDYVKIRDANTYLNVLGGDRTFVAAATSHPSFGRIWRSAFAYYDPAVRLDFSDTGELMHILGLGELGVSEFRQRYLEARAPGREGAFATGRYRNLFQETGRSQQEVRQKIDAAFRQLFHGDAANEAVFYWAGQNANGRLAYLSDINNKDVRSEGMSYGMMIAVQLDKKAEFDALWNWSRTYMYHEDTKHPASGFFSWSMNLDGTPRSESPAPDGEEYYVMALYFASARWGDGTGIYDYRAVGDRLLSDIKNRGVITGPWVSRPARTETDGAQFNLQHKMVRFTPDMARPDHTDPSYHLPAFYELWARWGPEADRPFWKAAAAISRDFFQKTTNPATGLAPEYANFDGTPVSAAFNRRSDTFGPDAWRTAANWSVDWSWWAADPRERELSDRIQAFFESKGISTYGNRWTLDGTTQLDPSHSTALVATNAVAGLAATNPRAARFVDELWKASIPSGQYRYYDGLWYLMGLLHCSGEYRIWTPPWAAK